MLLCFGLTSCGKETYTVRFENENGDFIKNVTVSKGDKVASPETVTEYEGYTFDGWYLDGEEYSFDSKVKSDLTLVAKYQANHYTLSFGEGVNPIEVVYGQPVGQLPNVPNPEGKEYGVWMLDGVILTSMTIYNYTEDKQAVADYSEELFVVSFVGAEQTNQFVTYGSKVIEPRVPQKAGYDFAGWYLNGEKYNFNAVVVTNLTLEAKWKPRHDTAYNINVFVETDDDYLDVTEDYENLTANLFGTTESVVDITEVAQQAIPTNYVLNVEKSTLEGSIVGDGSLVLSIYFDVVRYTVSFDVDGVEDQMIKIGSQASIPTRPEMEGYVFHSWLLGEDEYDFSSMVTGDITLTPKWLKAKEHVITFDSLHEEEVKAQTLDNGEVISTPSELEKVGYVFDGWYLGDEKWNFNTSLTTSHPTEINLVAKWLAREYVLSFDESGTEPIVVTYDQPIGQLPELIHLSSNKTGNWTIDGVVIDADTVWRFDLDKEANSKYYVDMSNETIDLSTKGESDLATQLLTYFGVVDGSVQSIKENDCPISKTYLADIEATATDEASRIKSLVVIIGNTEYKLNVFFATKVIYTYDELTKIQQYGGLEISKFPADYNYTMYGYSGYFVLGNDIDASPSMTNTYKVGTMGRYDSQVWDNEMTGFKGVFDGRGHTIDRLYTAAGGLLGDVLEGSIIRNLAITNAKIVEGNAGAGILCYIFSHAIAENLYIDFTTAAGNSGIFGRMNKAGAIRNVVVKYNNTGVSGGVLSSWQVNTTNIPYPVFENVTFIYEKGTDISKMKAIGNSAFTSANIKEYIIQSDNSLLAIKSKSASGTNFTSYTTGKVAADEFVSYDETYWDLSGIYPVLK